MPDRVHLLVEVDPQFGIHRLIKRIKGLTSHDLRKEFASCLVTPKNPPPLGVGSLKTVAHIADVYLHTHAASDSESVSKIIRTFLCSEISPGEKDFARREEWLFCFNNHSFVRGIHLLAVKLC